MESVTEIQIFFKSGYDNLSPGACYQSQRVLMIMELKYSSNVIPKFTKTPVNISKPPKVFKELGLHLRVPALYLKFGNNNEEFEPMDFADDIVIELESRFPGGLMKSDIELEAEIATRNFFSKFCHWMRGVSKDSSHLEAELTHINNHLSIVAEAAKDKLYLCGESPALIDCEVLPKLHQVRVAAEGIKGYEIPRHLTYLWRYLHTAYSEPAFINSCPTDTEILLNWLDSGSDKLSVRQQQLLAASAGKPPVYSFTVPVTATRVVIE